MMRGLRVVLGITFLFGAIFCQFIIAPPSRAISGCLYGDGTAASPWLVHDSAELACFETHTWYFPGGPTIYVSLLADVIKTNDVKLFNTASEVSIVFSGNSHTITVDGVTDFKGIFQDSSNSEFKDLSVAAINGSTLANSDSWEPGYGWLVSQDYSGTFNNIHIDAPISDHNGGIIGSAYSSHILNSSSTGIIGTNAAGGLVHSAQLDPHGYAPYTLIEKSHSTGFIGYSSGGILGIAFANTEINRSYSTGDIDNGGAGGIVGQSYVSHTLGNQLVIKSSYSTGEIGNSSGGILGQYSSNFVIQNVYTTGNIHNNAGGIVGANASDGVVTNSYTLGDLLSYAGGIFGRLRDSYDTATTLSAMDIYVAGSFVIPNDSPGGIVTPGPNQPNSGTINQSNLVLTYSNIYSPENNGSPGWTDVTAATVLTGYQGWGGSYVWIQCTINTPALISALYTRNPCAPEPTEEPTSEPTSGSSSSPTPAVTPSASSHSTLSRSTTGLAKTGVSGMSLGLLLGLGISAVLTGAAVLALSIRNKSQS